MKIARGFLSSLNALLVTVIVGYCALMIFSLGNRLLRQLTTDGEGKNGIKRNEFKYDYFRFLQVQNQSDVPAAAEAAGKQTRVHSLGSLCSSPLRTTCEVIHVAVLSAKSSGAREAALLIKSILIHRSTRIHFHFLVDDMAQVILKELLRTWNISGVQYAFYLLADIQALDGLAGLEILQLQAILPSTIQKVIVLNASRMLNSDPRELWCHFDRFDQGQHIGSVIVGGSSVRLGVMLLDLAGLRTLPWPQLYGESREVALAESPAASEAGKQQLQAVLDGLLRRQPELFFPLPCQWNFEVTDTQSSCFTDSKSGIKVMNYDFGRLPKHDWMVYLWVADYDGNQLRDFLPESRKDTPTNHFEILNRHLVDLADSYSNPTCSDYAKEFIGVFRTHLFYMTFDYEPVNTSDEDVDDVTLVSQISISRMSILERLCKVWPGPVSVAIYLKDSDVRHFTSYVLHSHTFSGRKNIAFHLMYLEGSQYPTNHLRNVAGMGIKTSYAFLIDVDFMPVEDVYRRIMGALPKIKNYTSKTVFVVPGFETKETNHMVPIPKSKEEMALLWDQGTFVSFRERVYPEGHRASNYTKWRNATEPYPISYEFGYEPYIVIRSKEIPHYDERFLGYGGDKLSHIMELAASGFSFVVLPDVFVVHLPHGVSFDSIRFRSSHPMRRCLVAFFEDFGTELVKKYGNATLNGWKPKFLPPRPVKS